MVLDMKTDKPGDLIIGSTIAQIIVKGPKGYTNPFNGYLWLRLTDRETRITEPYYGEACLFESSGKFSIADVQPFLLGSPMQKIAIQAKPPGTVVWTPDAYDKHHIWMVVEAHVHNFQSPIPGKMWVRIDREKAEVVVPCSPDSYVTGHIISLDALVLRAL